MRLSLLALCALVLLGCGRPTPLPAPPTAIPVNDQPTPVVAAAATPAAAPPTAPPTVAPLPPTPPPASPTPRPPATRRASPTPGFQPVTKRMGPLRDSSGSDEYALEITLTNVRFLDRDGDRVPPPGHQFIVVDFAVKNLGPGPLRALSTTDFSLRDAADAIREPHLVAAAAACRLWLINEIPPGGRRTACLGFLAQTGGAAEFIYRPLAYARDGFTPGRFLGFPLRDATGAPVVTAPNPTPAATAVATTPTMAPPVTGRLGPVPGLSNAPPYTIEVTVLSRRYWRGDAGHQPAPGQTVLILDLEIRNLGPGNLVGLSPGDFVIHDADKNMIYAGIYSVTQECRLAPGELLPGGVRRGCFGYPVPLAEPLDLVHVPGVWRQEGHRPGRHLAFRVHAP